MKKLSIVVFLLAVMSVIPTIASAAVGDSDNGLVDDEWYLDLNTVYGWGWLGVTPAIVNLPDVNSYGGEPASDLEIVTGSDGIGQHWNPYIVAPGLWRAIDSKGNIEWYRNTQSDEARGSVAITDLNGDGNLEIVGGTTSGHTIEVMNRFGNFVWTFPSPPMAGAFEWPTAPAVADLNTSVSGLEVIAVHRPTGTVVVLDGDNSDGIDDGIHFTGIPSGYGYPYTFTGNEGTDWDVLWNYTMGGYDNHGSAAIGDVDNDGALEVVVGSQNGNVYVLNGATGAVEATFTTTSVQASPALANLDSDPYLEIVIGNLAGTLYVFEWDGTTASTQSSASLGSAIYSSAAIGNIDSDSGLEIIVGTLGGQVYALTSSLAQEWVYPSTGSAGAFYASPSLANRGSGSPYGIEWQMFRHDAKRTGYYGSSANPLDVYIGSMDGYLYLLNGDDGALVDRFQSSGPIHGSPTIGDIDGDGRLNIIFQSWGAWGTDAYTDKDRLWNVEEKVIKVTIDIKPGSFPNSINLANEGTVPVAILSTPTFDATTVNPLTVTLAGAPVKLKGKGTPMAAKEDVNGDGLLDLVVHVSTGALQLSSSDTEAVLEGKTFDGVPIIGTDSVRIVPS